jgi:hypothetical protein
MIGRQFLQQYFKNLKLGFAFFAHHTETVSQLTEFQKKKVNKIKTFSVAKIICTFLIHFNG